MNFNLGELFSGPGGMALGAKLAAEEFAEEHSEPLPIEHVWGVDMDPKACETYNENHLGEGICIDANAFVDGQEGHEKTISSFEKISALAFGFPCNDFSLVGEQKGFQGKFGNLYKAGIKAIEHSDPLFFVAENVSGIHSANSDAAFYKIIKDLESAGQGYNVTTHLYKFENYGVPQARHRYIIVGIRKDQKRTFKVPAPTHLDNYVSVKEKLSEPYKVDQICNNERTRQQPQIEERLLFTPPWRNAWYLEEMLAMTPENRREALKEASWYEEKIACLSDQEIVERIEGCRLHCTRAKMSHIYRRLHPDKPSYTITGSGGGGTHVYHWEECRALTNRERARLQSFPDDFVFTGSKEQVRKQIGMAVPPKGAKIIFKAILDTFAGKEYPSLDEPSYQPMDEEEFSLYRFKRFKDRLKTKLRRNFEFDLQELNDLSDLICSWVNSDLSIDEVECEIVARKLINLKKKTI